MAITTKVDVEFVSTGTNSSKGLVQTVQVKTLYLRIHFGRVQFSITIIIIMILLNNIRRGGDMGVEKFPMYYVFL